MLSAVQYAAQRRWNRKNKDKIRAYTRAWYKRNRARICRLQRERNKRNFLANPEAIRERKRHYHRTWMQKKVGRPRPAACELCNEPFKRQPHADHDHATGKYRGWICGRCNSVLGFVRDSVEFLGKIEAWIINGGLKC